MNDRSDHDLLIQIEAKLDMYNKQFIDHVRSDSEDHGEMKKAVYSAHRRIDYLMIGGVVAVLGLIVTVWVKA